MSMFNDDNYEEGVGQTRKKGIKWFFIAGIFAFLFAPVTAFFYFCYDKMFKKMRLRPHLPILLSIIVSLFFGWLLVSKELYKPKFFETVFSDGFSFSEIGNITEISFIDVIVYIFTFLWSLGFSLVFIPVILTISSSIIFMKRNPAYTQIEGEWSYQWEYRRTPLEVLKRKKRIDKLLNGQANESNKAALGLSADYETRDQIVYRHDKEALQHMFIVGASGSGKSMTTLSMVKSDIESGTPVTMIDFKRSDEMAIKMAQWAHENNRPFYHFLDCDPEEYNIPYSDSPCVYNPFANAGDAIPDMLVGMRQYDTASDVYKKSASELTQAIQKMLRETDKKHLMLDGPNGNKSAIPWEKGEIYVWLAAMENMEVLHHGYKTTRKEKGLEQDFQMAKTVAQAAKPSTQMNIAIASVRGQLLTLTNSSYGQWFDETNDYKKINLFDNNSPDSQGAVTLFSFSSDKQKDFSKSFGALVFQDLTNVSSNRRQLGIQNDVHVYADEFQVVAPDCITGLVEKARSSKMGMTFISQSLMQIVKEAGNNGEAVLRSLLDSCSNYIAHNGSNQDSATILAEIIGKQPVTRYSMQKETNSSLFAINFFNRRRGRIASQQDEDWVCSPNRFTSLKQPRQSAKGQWLPGEAIIINRAPNGIETEYALARKVELFLPKEVTAPVNGSLSKPTTTLSIEETEENTPLETSVDIDDTDFVFEDILENEYEDYDETPNHSAKTPLNEKRINQGEKRVKKTEKPEKIISNKRKDNSSRNRQRVNSTSNNDTLNNGLQEEDWLSKNKGQPLTRNRKKIRINPGRNGEDYIESQTSNKEYKSEKFDLEETMFNTVKDAKKPPARKKPHVTSRPGLPVKKVNNAQQKSNVTVESKVKNDNSAHNEDNAHRVENVDSFDDIIKKKQEMLDRFK